MTEKCAASRRRFKILFCGKKRSTAKKQHCIRTKRQKNSTPKKTAHPKRQHDKKGARRRSGGRLFLIFILACKLRSLSVSTGLSLPPANAGGLINACKRTLPDRRPQTQNVRFPSASASYLSERYFIDRNPTALQPFLSLIFLPLVVRSSMVMSSSVSACTSEPSSICTAIL